jgi:poly(A) polymerase
MFVSDSAQHAQGAEQQGSSNPLLNDVLEPLANSAVVQPYNTLAGVVNFATKHLAGHELLPEASEFKVQAARPFTPEWALQTMSGGVGALVPYTIAGKAMGSAMRGVGGLTETEALAAALKSEQLAYVGGAFAYDGLRKPAEGETRLGNALGGAAGFGVFGAGNRWAQGLEQPLQRLSGRFLVGSLGGATSIGISSAWSRHELPTSEEWAQAALGGAMMNGLLPPSQEFIARKTTEWQAHSRFGAPIDRYLQYTPEGQALQRSPQLDALIQHNPWARVQVGTDAAEFARLGNRIQIPQELASNPGRFARELAHVQDARQGTFEPQYRQAAELLKAGRIDESWQAFRWARSQQEASAHLAENRVNNELTGAQLLSPEFMPREMGAWPAPRGLTYEGRWRQEFSRFIDTGGAWRPGRDFSGAQAFDPSNGKRLPWEMKDPAELSLDERKALEARTVATQLVRELQQDGHIGVFAGGSVRDEATGALPHDYDIATSATPEQVERLFRDKGYSLAPIGKSFGVVSVFVPSEITGEYVEYQIATLRNDGQYSDGRRPDNVQYVGSLHEDAARRDLTMNAMFKDPITETRYDFFGGQQDIDSRLIRTVGDPGQRFTEDKLRMMRVARFAAQLGFDVDRQTLAAIQEHAPEIQQVSGERVRDELSKILLSGNPRLGLTIMMDSGLMRQVLPEVADLTGPRAMQDPVWHPEGSVWNHTQMVVDELRGSSFPLMMSGLLHDIGKPATQEIHPDGRITNYGHAEVGAEMAARIADRLRLPNAEKARIVRLVEDHMKVHTIDEWRRAKLLEFLNSDRFEDQMNLQHADSMGTGNPDRFSKSKREWALAQREAARNADDPAQRLGAPPIIDGRALIELGIKPGKRLGEIKNAAMEAQREGAFNDRESALRWLAENFEEFRH